MFIATMTVPQLQALILAVCAMAIVVIPVVTAVILLAVSQFGRVREAIGKIEVANGDVVHHGLEITRLAERSAVNTARIDQLREESWQNKTGGPSVQPTAEPVRPVAVEPGQPGPAQPGPGNLGADQPAGTT